MIKLLYLEGMRIYKFTTLAFLAALNIACSNANVSGLSYFDTCDRDKSNENVILPFIVSQNKNIKANVCIVQNNFLKIENVDDLTVLHIKPSKEQLKHYEEYLEKPKSKGGIRLLKPRDSFKIKIELNESNNKRYADWMSNRTNKTMALVLNGKVIEYRLLIEPSKRPSAIFIGFGEKALLANSIAKEIKNTIKVKTYRLLTEPNNALQPTADSGG